jgi:hypothetical protein
MALEYLEGSRDKLIKSLCVGGTQGDPPEAQTHEEALAWEGSARHKEQDLHHGGRRSDCRHTLHDPPALSTDLCEASEFMSGLWYRMSHLCSPPIFLFTMQQTNNCFQTINQNTPLLTNLQLSTLLGSK